MSDIVIKYTSVEDVYEVLDAAYQALFSSHTYSNGSGMLTLVSGAYVIPAYTFEDIPLDSLECSEGILSFGQRALKNSGIDSLVLPKSFHSMSLNALSDNIISTLECHAVEVPELYSQENLTISVMYVPKNSINAYQNSDWADYVLEFRPFDECVHKGYGFNICKMIDTNYIIEVYKRR